MEKNTFEEDRNVYLCRFFSELSPPRSCLRRTRWNHKMRHGSNWQGRHLCLTRSLIDINMTFLRKNFLKFSCCSFAGWDLSFNIYITNSSEKIMIVRLLDDILQIKRLALISDNLTPKIIKTQRNPKFLSTSYCPSLYRYLTALFSIQILTHRNLKSHTHRQRKKK